MSEDQFLDFKMNSMIIGVIKQHRANTAAMAREICELRSKVEWLQKSPKPNINTQRKINAALDDLRKIIKMKQEGKSDYTISFIEGLEKSIQVIEEYTGDILK